jgi:hypothetical protein
MCVCNAPDPGVRNHALSNLSARLITQDTTLKEKSLPNIRFSSISDLLSLLFLPWIYFFFS